MLIEEKREYYNPANSSGLHLRQHVLSHGLDNGRKMFISVLWPAGIRLPCFSLTTPFQTHLGT